MLRSATLITILSLCGSAALAQRNSGSLPRVGTLLPNVSAFDEEGKQFELSELRGEYSVLVFGCLT